MAGQCRSGLPGSTEQHDSDGGCQDQREQDPPRDEYTDARQLQGPGALVLFGAAGEQQQRHDEQRTRWMLADEEDTLPQMNDHLYDWAGAEPRPYDWPKIVATLRDMTTAEDDGLRAAAATLLADLPTNRLGEDAW